MSLTRKPYNDRGTDNNDLARSAYEGRRDGTMTPEQRDVAGDLLIRRVLDNVLPEKLLQDLDAA